MKTFLSQLASLNSPLCGGVAVGTLASDWVNAVKKIVFLGSLLGALSPGLAQTANALPQNLVITTVNVGSYPIGLVVSPDSSTVYVANSSSGTISVIDATSNYAIKATITLPTNTYPECLAITPDGTKLYATNHVEQGTVSVIDTTQPTYPVVATLNVGAYPYGLAVTPNGMDLWVANQGSTYGQIPGTISVFATATGTLQTTLEPGGNPWLLAFAKQGAQADVLNYASTGFIQSINSTSWTVGRSVGAAGQLIYPDGMTTNGGSLYITDAANYVSVCNAGDGVQTVQLLAVPNVYDDYELGQPAVTKNGKYLYVPYFYNAGAESAGNQVAMLELATGQLVGTPITVGDYPYWTQISPNGQTLYVVNEIYGTGSVTVVNITP
ncbi:MAG: YncE family protein [Chthoniobacterales bacterium]